MAQGFAAALCHHLDRQAAVEIGVEASHSLKSVLSPAIKAVDEGVVLFARHRAVDVIGAGAAGTDLVVARLKPGLLHVDAVAVHDRRDGVEESQRLLAGALRNRGGKIGRGQRAGGDDDAVPLVRRNLTLAALQRDRAAATSAPR